ncbi:MAG: hypothetical protein ACYCXI_07230 [Dethiobacteraceae bacterium]
MVRLLIRFVRYLVELIVGGVIVAIALTTVRQTWYPLSMTQIYIIVTLALVLAVVGFYVHRWRGSCASVLSPADPVLVLPMSRLPRLSNLTRPLSTCRICLPCTNKKNNGQ